MKWINTVEAATEVEQAGNKGQWRIGDAIIRDLKENGLQFGSRTEGKIIEIKDDVFRDCATKLADRGIEHNGNPYDSKYVRRLFQAALAFERDDRNPKYSWDAHREAGTPANLKKAAAALRVIGKSVSIYNVRALISHWAEEADAERKKELAKAKAKKDAAKKKKAKASEDKLATKDKAARDEADKRREEAQREIDEAKDAIKELGSPPPFNADLDVDTSDVSALERWAVYLSITQHTLMMKREAKKTLKDVERLAKVLTASEQQTIADGCNEVIAILEEINNVVKRPARKFAAIAGGRS